MPKIAVFFSCCMMFLCSVASGQDRQISGVVTDAESGEPLVGVNVVVGNTRIGSTTDTLGKFVIARFDTGTYVLRFSMVGYGTVERSVTVATDPTRIRIQMEAQHVEEDIVVVTGTRTRHSIADVPVRIEAIPQEEVEEKLLMTPSSVAMLLNESTGMRVQTTSAASNTANLRIQGLSGRYTQTLIDGIPSLGGVAAGLSLMQLVPLDLQQVEILKGATSSLYGADAIAGIVNFIPKEPGARDEVSILTNATTQNGLDIAGFSSRGFASGGWSLLASYNRQALFDVDGDRFADIAEFERLTVTPRILYRVSEDLSIRMGLSFMSERRIGGVIGDDGTAGSGGSRYVEQIETDRLDATAQADWTLSDDRTASVKLAFLTSERNAVFGSDPFRGGQRVIFADAQYPLSLSRHELLIGSAFRIDEFMDTTPGISSPRSYRSVVPSLFSQSEIHLSEKYVFVAGARLDLHNEFRWFFVPRASLMYRPLPTLTFRLGGGMGYRAPTIFVEEAEQAGFRGVRPLVGVMPERSRSASVDVNWRSVFGEATLDCNTAVFWTDLKDALIADSDSLASDVVFLRNVTGLTTTIGAEVSLKISVGKLKLSLGYTYLQARQDDQDRSTEVALNPTHSAGLIAFWEDHDNQLKVGLENYYTGSQRVERNPFRSRTPSYWITGIMSEKGFGPWRIFLNLENIFDTRQTRFDPLIVGGLTAGTLRQLPVYAPTEGRVINGGVRLVLLDH